MIFNICFCSLVKIKDDLILIAFFVFPIQVKDLARSIYDRVRRLTFN